MDLLQCIIYSLLSLSTTITPVYPFKIASTENSTQKNTSEIQTFSLEELALREDKAIRVSPMAIPTGYVISRPSPSSVDRVGVATNNKQDVTKDVSETDLYLLGAIEKLVYRMDLMDQRVRRTEELVQHLIEGSNIKRQDPCPGNFTRVGRNCYHFSERQYNWKSATSMCKSIGGNLLELENNEEFMEIVEYMMADHSIRGHEYWTAGLNPGLLWIWANSARPVLPKDTEKPEEVIAPGSGRCLKLSYGGPKYSYSGSDCAMRIRFICEHEENLTQRALKRIHKALKDSNQI